MRSPLDLLRLLAAALMLAMLVACGGGGSASTAVTPPPAVPGGVTATATSPTTVTVSWTAASGAAGYTVYRDGTQVATATTTTFSDSGLTAASTYRYTVAATAGASLSSAQSTAVSVTTPVAVPAAPGGLTAVASSATTVELNWTAVAGASGYLVLRDGTPLTSGATTSTPPYGDSGLTGGTTYSYTVIAINASGQSAPSAPASATTPVPLPVVPATPAGLSALATSNVSVTLNWTAVGPTQAGAVSYRVFRNGNTLAIGTTPTPGYVDASASQATTYSYTVEAYDAAANQSPQSAAQSVTTPGPTTPAGLSASAGSNTTIALTWTAATDTLPLTGYRVYRDGSALAASVVTTAYTDSGLLQATPHTYTVVALDASYQSAPSQSVSATTAGPSAPTLSVTGTGLSSVSLAWTTASDTLGVAGYRLYRRAGGASGLGALVATTMGTSYVDAGIPLAGAYTYTVVAFDASNYTATSNPATSGNVANPSPLLIAPRQVALTRQQTQQYTATAGGQAPAATIAWSVDGIAGGSATVGTISATGLYTPPATAGHHQISATAGANASVTGASVAVTDLAGVYGYHVDNARTGQNLQEYALNASSIAGGNFGRLYSCDVDGDVYAQPLYVANVTINGAVHNVVYVATMNDTVYAFDADHDTAPCTPLWKSAYATGGAVPVPIGDIGAGCNDILTQYGITGTPTVDPVGRTLYFVTKTKESGNWFQRLHAVDLATGIDRAGSPALISASTQSSSGATVHFDALLENQRAGLALANGQVYIAWGAHCDVPTWHGWVLAYDAGTLAQTAVFNATPSSTTSGGGGVWMSGAAPATDAAGNLYVTTGNGPFDSTLAVVPPLAAGADYGESYLKLSPALSVADFYTPSQNAAWSASDKDLSSSGVTVLPDGTGPGAHPNVVVGTDKQAHLWMLDRAPPGASGTSMGGFAPAAENVVEYLTLPVVGSACAYQDGLTTQGTVTYWNGIIYSGVAGGQVMAFALSGGQVPNAAGVASPTAATSDVYGFPLPTAMISAAAAAPSALLWTLDTNANGINNCNAPAGPPVLRAYDASTLGAALYSSSTVAADAALGTAIKFQVPLIANGHVYVAAAGKLNVYGLLP